MIEAQEWYEHRAAGLGPRFRHSLDRVIKRLTQGPTQFPIVYKNVRRAVLRHFPYSLFFIVEGENLIVIACLHGSRDPNQWQSRT